MKLDKLFMGHVHYPSYEPYTIEYKGKKYTLHVTGAAMRFNNNSMLELDLDIDADGISSNIRPFGREAPAAGASR